MAECDNCGYDTELGDYAYGTKVYGFCEICAGSFLSRATTASRYLEQSDIWLFRSIAFIANILRSEIRTHATRQQGGEEVVR